MDGVILEAGDTISPDLIKEVEDFFLELGIEPLESETPIKMEKSMSFDDPKDLAPLIEHTSLKPDVTKKQVIRLCKEAKRCDFYGVCVNPIFVKDAFQLLEGSGRSVISVVGFPLGANITSVKAEEARNATHDRANEIDMMIALGALKGREYVSVYNDIRAVVEASKPIPVKVIIEAGLLDLKEKIYACVLALWAGASCLKTSTGFAYKNKSAKIDDIPLMRAAVKNKIGIKAAGGISDYKTAKAMVEAGASRIGSSSSVSIVMDL
jgi:deoxyribose-phosphate aldolase